MIQHGPSGLSLPLRHKESCEAFSYHVASRFLFLMASGYTVPSDGYSTLPTDENDPFCDGSRVHEVQRDVYLSTDVARPGFCPLGARFMAFESLQQCNYSGKLNDFNCIGPNRAGELAACPQTITSERHETEWCLIAAAHVELMDTA